MFTGCEHLHHRPLTPLSTVTYFARMLKIQLILYFFVPLAYDFKWLMLLCCSRK